MSQWPPPPIFDHMPTPEKIIAATEPQRAKSLEGFRAMSDEDLVRRHDWLAVGDGTGNASTSVGINYYLNEIARRDAVRINEQMLQFTKEVRYLTWIIAVLTLAVTVLTALTLLR